MKITKVTTTVLQNSNSLDFQDATMFKNTKGPYSRRQLFVHIHTDAGVEGLGVAAGISATRAVIHDILSDVLIDQDPFNIEMLWYKMFWYVRGLGIKGVSMQAISAVDIALWDLKAKALGLPLYRLLGPAHTEVPVYGSGGWTNFDIPQLIAEQDGYVKKGFTKVKMKVGKDFGQSEREDVERLRAVRKALGDDVEIFIDANNGYYAKQAIRMAGIFEEYNVGWFEEPVIPTDIDGLRAVAVSTPIPVATGEHEYTKHGFADLISRQGADIVQPDVGRLGGITEWMKVAAMAHAFNLPVAPHAFQLIHLHCAMATPNIKVVEMLGVETESNLLWYKDFPMPQNGMWKPHPDKLGLGLELNPHTVRNNSVD